MLGFGSQSEEICATTYSEAGISWFQDPHPANDSIESSGENEEDPTRCSQVTDLSTPTVREVAQFMGKASAAIRALPTAPLHYRALQFLMNSEHPVEWTASSIL